jgi:predicted dithiol-disulfide oxidoreductase (DUF899 family)
VNKDAKNIPSHTVVSPEQWLAARTAFLQKEKEFDRVRHWLQGF